VGSNPALGLRGFQPPNQNCADDNDKQNSQLHFAFPILSKHFGASVLIRVTNFPTPRRLPEWSIEEFRSALCGTLRKVWLRCAALRNANIVTIRHIAS
jgi:hypothetical protein